jgi:hypothetical protein
MTDDNTTKASDPEQPELSRRAQWLLELMRQPDRGKPVRRGTPITSGRSSPQASDAIVARIARVLADKPVERQGMVLARCLAIWLVGHEVEDDPEATRALREALLASHLGLVCGLTRLDARTLGTRP